VHVIPLYVFQFVLSPSRILEAVNFHETWYGYSITGGNPMPLVLISYA